MKACAGAAAGVALAVAAFALAGGGGGRDGPPAPGFEPSLASGAGAAGAPARWRPRGRPLWQYQLAGRVDTSVRAEIYGVDGFDTPRATVAALQRRGARVLCYVSAGSIENWRPDAGRFPRTVIGRPLDGWPGERWLDVRRTRELLPIMRARIEMCARKGFDGVDFDNVDAYANRSGFPLTAADGRRYSIALAALAHRRGLAVALKNDLDQAAALAPHFDLAVVEQCFQYSECERARPFLRAGKPVLVVEYSADALRHCDRARRLGVALIRKRLDLRAWRRTCPATAEDPR